MPAPPLLYYITDRNAFSGDELFRHRRVLGKISEAAEAGVDYIQIREKDLNTRDLELLAAEAARMVRGSGTALLINSRADVARAVGADGVHLPANDLSPAEIKAAWHQCGAGARARELLPRIPFISISCHDPAQVAQAVQNGADLALFAPVFEKENAPPAGLEALRQACRAKIPVLALGGITLENARACLRAGAAGIAAIRLFQEHDIAEVATTLRAHQ